MCYNLVAVFYSRLALEAYSFGGYNYKWRITLSSESSRVPTSGTNSLGTGLVSYKLASYNMSTIHIFCITVIILALFKSHI